MGMTPQSWMWVRTQSPPGLLWRISASVWEAALICHSEFIFLPSYDATIMRISGMVSYPLTRCTETAHTDQERRMCAGQYRNVVHQPHGQKEARQSVVLREPARIWNVVEITQLPLLGPSRPTSAYGSDVSDNTWDGVLPETGPDHHDFRTLRSFCVSGVLVFA